MKRSIIVLAMGMIFVLGGCGDRSVTPKQISPEGTETIEVETIEVEEIQVEPIKVQTFDNSTTGWVSDDYKKELEYNSKKNVYFGQE